MNAAHHHPPALPHWRRPAWRLGFLLMVLAGILAFQTWPWWLPQQGDGDYVVLLHGLGRSSGSMRGMEAFLRRNGYEVVNINYPSRTADLETLTRETAAPAIAKRCPRPKPIHFVTHSMGGILVRHLLADGLVPEARLGRIVMLAPPNQGSEVVDFLKHRWLLARILGPAFPELGVGAERPAPPRNGTAIGIVCGDRSINWINSTLIPGPDDGKVAVERGKLPEMADFLLVHRTHPWIMDAPEVQSATVRFLKRGKFLDPEAAALRL